jgi:S1-C subfamily serine protease
MLDVIVARNDGRSGGRVWDEDASRIGVEEVEFSVDGGRTRFARRKVKKAEAG